MIADPQQGQEYARIIVNNVGKQKLIQDVAKHLHFLSSLDLIEQLKKDNIYMFETHLGWMWPFIWNLIVEFANDKNCSNLEEFGTKSSKHYIFRKWLDSKCSQLAQSMRVETANKDIKKLTSQQCANAEAMKSKIFVKSNYIKCLSNSCLTYDSNRQHKLANLSYVMMPGIDLNAWNVFNASFERERFHYLRQKVQKQNAAKLPQKQKWRNRNHCKNRTISQKKEYSKIMKYNKELKQKQCDQKQRARKKQIQKFHKINTILQ